MAKPGRKPIDRELLLEVCDYIADGGSLRGSCEAVGISAKTFCQHLRKDKELGEHYTCARDLRGHDNADAVMDIQRRVLLGEIAPDAARVALDALKWTAGKWNRKDYGEKTAIVGGDEGDAPIQVATTDRDRAKAVLELMRRAKNDQPSSE